MQRSMQENNELQTYSPEEVEQLIAMTEDLQTENEQQRAELKRLRRQQQIDLSDKQRLSEKLQSVVQDLTRMKVENRNLHQKLHQLKQQSNEDEQLLLVQKLTEKLSEQQRQTQTVLSDNQKLKSQVQQLTAKNESLQSSDEQLKNAEELKKQSARQEQQAKERERRATAEADRARREAAAAIARAEQKEEAAIIAKNAAEHTKQQQESIIKEKAEALNRQYQVEWNVIGVALIVYSLFATVFTAIKSKRCMSDITAAGKLIAKIAKGIVHVITALASRVGSVGAKIPQPIVSTIVSYLLMALITAICVVVILAPLYLGIKAISNCYTLHCWDEVSPLVALVCLAVLVWGAELMPLNIVLLLILSHAAYIVVRWYIDGWREARGLA